MKTAATEHWDRVYATKAPNAVSWYTEHLERSLELLGRCGLGEDTAVIDVGGGASTLVDDLLARGCRDVSVLDLSSEALAAAQARLGPDAARVTWLVGDVIEIELEARRYDVWHDRTVFHFLTNAEQRRCYVARVTAAVRPGGHVIVATFGPNGPERCSNLEVARYDAESLHAELGPDFIKVGSEIELHTTPWGAAQEFVYCLLRVG